MVPCHGRGRLEYVVVFSTSMNESLSRSQRQGSVFVLPAEVLWRTNAQPVLAGGYTLNANYVQRMTFDIDCAVTAEECARLEPVLITAGYSVFNRQNASVPVYE